MGIEDRDWYREETAKKNGLRYNKKNATYSAAAHVVNSSMRNSSIKSPPAATSWHWSLQLALWLVIVLLVVVLVRFLNYLA